jgi:hypothetical protein
MSLEKQLVSKKISDAVCPKRREGVDPDEAPAAIQVFLPSLSGQRRDRRHGVGQREPHAPRECFFGECTGFCIDQAHENGIEEVCPRLYAWLKMQVTQLQRARPYRDRHN